jgi:hypothetical protein
MNITNLNIKCGEDWDGPVWKIRALQIELFPHPSKITLIGMMIDIMLYMKHGQYRLYRR